MTTKISGIIVNKQDYRLVDVIVNIYTINGIIAIYCPGVRKITSKNQAFLQLFNYCEFELFFAYSKNKMHRLKTGVILETFPNIHSNYERLMVTNYLVKLCSELAEDTNIIFNELLVILQNINNDKNEVKKQKSFLTFKVLKLLGLQLQLNHCSICKSNKNIKTINWSAGGFICCGCFKNEQQIFPISLLQALYELNHEPEFEQWKINQDDLYVLIPFYYE
ncbi:DNA repair protein RecO [Spiroplasma endosymbiont of Asaphidion curtum]|uniref:DNA repair protein RecO n=1 Tax=Spiroplasma endosymbiont of Asaphidion curtum TaxID=3066281 RepID=UPI00313B3B15